MLLLWPVLVNIIANLATGLFIYCFRLGQFSY